MPALLQMSRPLLPLAAWMVLVVGIACNRGEQAPPTEAPAQSVPVQTEAAGEVVDAPSAVPADVPEGRREGIQPLRPLTELTPLGKPSEMYAMCKDRVEGADLAGECSSDADCVKAGCSQEMCISSSDSAKGIMSTCEVRPCFAILKDCGCVSGVCSWRVDE